MRLTPASFVAWLAITVMVLMQARKAGIQVIEYVKYRMVRRQMMKRAAVLMGRDPKC